MYDRIRTALEEYRTQREHLRIQEQEHTLHTLLMTGSEHAATDSRLQYAGIDPRGSIFYVITFFATRISDPVFDKSHGTLDFLRVLFRSTIMELAEQSHTACAFCQDHKGGVAVLYGSHDSDGANLEKTVLEMSKKAIDILNNSYDICVQTTISSPVFSARELPEAYQRTLSLFRFARSIGSDALIISQDEFQRSSGVLLNGDFIRQEQILINTVLTRKYDAVPSMAESILSTHVATLKKNYTLAHGRLQSVSNVLVEGVRMASLPDGLAEEYAQRIGQADSLSRLTEATREVYGRMAELCRESSGETDPVTIACSFISQNLSDRNLNVSAICEAAGVSVQRLTRMFQSRFDMAVAEYMNACRIKLAKELLPDRQLTVSQISQRVGYNNTDTFTRNFRKLEGITPSEYRKMVLENDDK